MNYPYDNAQCVFMDEDAGEVFTITMHADHDGCDDPDDNVCEGCFAQRLIDGTPEAPVAPFYFTTDNHDPSQLAYCTECVEDMIDHAKATMPDQNQGA